MPHPAAPSLASKEARLIESLRPLGRVIVAFSGGADSAYLAWAAHQALGRDALAVTADSPSFPRSHKRDAEAFTAQFGIAHEFIATNEFDNPDYAATTLTAVSIAKTSSSPVSNSSAASARLNTSFTAST